MKIKITLLTSIVLLISTSLLAQSNTKDFSVQTNVAVAQNPLRLNINIIKHSGGIDVDSLKIFRKSPSSNDWGSAVVKTGSVSSDYLHIDSTITLGTTYEYKIVKHFGTYVAYGYVMAGANIPAIENRGKILFLIDSTKVNAMSTQLLLMEKDLIGDGWQVVRLYANPTDAVASVKQKIITAYNLDKENTNSLLLFGDIPVPYSGVFGGNSPKSTLVPDGHDPNHAGAWPTDLYYGDMDEELWTDKSVKNSGQISRVENKNKRNDGKFDQMVLPSTLELSVGRVDLSDLPLFSKNETELLKQYIQKNHDYKHKLISISEEGIVDDNFGAVNNEYFASMGWGNFSTMYDVSNVKAGDFHIDLWSRNVQWGYGCGGGTYTAAGAVMNTGYLTRYNLNTPVFSVIFGSYFGDFDVTNNLLKACLATPELGLVSFWGGRPLWQLHKMAMGETIGQQAIMSQNNDGTYAKLGYDNQIQMNLMGDPTLRLNVVAPVSNVSSVRTNNDENVKVNWIAPTSQVVGYYVYRADDYSSAFVRITDNAITGTSFTDSLPSSAGAIYMVRAMKLETTASGTYYNLSQGIFTDDAGIQIQSSQQLLTTIDNYNIPNNTIMSVYPNPTTDGIINVTFSTEGNWDVYVTDVSGRAVTTVSHISSSATTFNLSNMAKGLYFVKAQKGSEQFIKKIMVQ